MDAAVDPELRDGEPPPSGTPLRDELSAVVRLAAPVALTHLGMMLMGTVDVMMLGRVSERALAAGALGNSVAVALTMLPMGIVLALDPLVAQAFGASDEPALRRGFQQGLVLAALLSIPLSAAMWPLDGPLRFLGQQEEIVGLSASYLRALIPGNLAFLLFVAVRHTLQAMSIVRPTLVAIVAANLVNVVANYALIFGHFGFPALGVVGSAWATSLARWTLLLILTLAALRVLRPRLRPWAPLVEPRFLARMLRIGFPIGLQISLEIWFFVTVALLMGNLGARELAAHQVALSLAALSFMVPLGIGGAAATRVGNALGRRSLEGARRSAAVCLGLGGLVMSVSAILFWLFPGLLARLFTDEAGVIALAVTLIPIAALFQVFDGLQVVAFGGLRGSADTRFPAAIAVVGFWLFGLPLGWMLAFRAGLGPRGLWWGFTLGLGAVALLLMWRMKVRFSRPITTVDGV